MSQQKRLNEFVTEELFMPYFHDIEEYEWLKMETESLIKMCQTYNIVPSFRSFNWESGYIPVNVPTRSKLEEVCWYVDMNKAYNTRLVSYLKHQKWIEENRKLQEEKEYMDKYYEAVDAFWDGLMVNNYQMYREFINSKQPHVIEEANRREQEYVDAYINQGKDLFACM